MWIGEGASRVKETGWEDIIFVEMGEEEGFTVVVLGMERKGGFGDLGGRFYWYG